MHKHSKPAGFVVYIRKVKNSVESEQIVLQNDVFTFDDIVGSSPQLEKVKSYTKKFAKLNSNILIQGESGTGKELFAKAIHNERCLDGPFLALNCAAIPSGLIESELFGYEGGAFTGAERKGRPGKIELAHGGTLFLDEIGDMPLKLQPVLLRVLEEHKTMRVGGSNFISIDFSLVAATNKDLQKLVAENKFREDLYYRIAVFKISIPPLRERPQDILTLSEYFIALFAQKQGMAPPLLNDDVKNILLSYSWPGNVRQLENAIFYSVNMCNGYIVIPSDLPDEITCAPPVFPKAIALNTITEAVPGGGNTIKDMERNAILKALAKTGGHIGKAAKLLGYCRATLYRKIRKYNMDNYIRAKG
jgi:transcriptional regulator with PAS, ATPase and Fis domain